MLVLAAPDPWTVVNVIAGTVSALAAFATVLIAVWAFREARRDKQADDEARHPDFSMHGSITTTEGSDTSHLELLFQNRGLNPAKDINAKLVLVGPPYDGNNNNTSAKDIVDTVHTISGFTIDDDLKLKEEGSAHFLLVKLEYQDGRTKKQLDQVFYRKWSAVGLFEQIPFEEVSREEVDFINGKAQKFLITKNGQAGS